MRYKILVEFQIDADDMEEAQIQADECCDLIGGAFESYGETVVSIDEVTPDE